ncbi:hypothetical protein [Mycobacteroides abscessus]|uniref:hypothetical protein n=1 Tax=Mycobacteroides abscessus TaxID=36809 RepID=UPI0009D5991B|nr:hypothetical protein [Mycobacteroides abscessus]SLF57798.1 Uncharacterised protein [Mycobacteroides abscessus subsp. abscessus]
MSKNPVEVIAKAWLRHQGYTDERIDAIVPGHNTGCELEGYSWNCRDEEGKPLHPDWDALVDACAIANVAVEALGGLTQEHVSGMRVGDDPRMEPIYESRWVSGWTVTK